eukprot:UN12960
MKYQHEFDLICISFALKLEKKTFILKVQRKHTASIFAYI